MKRDKCLKRIMLLLIVFLSVAFLSPDVILGAERKIKRPPQPQQQNVMTINDSNLQSSLKKAEEQVKKGEHQASLATFLRIYSYTRSVLTSINLLQKQYEKISNDPRTEQGDKEDLLVKLQRMDQLVSRYKKAKETSAYYIGYIYTKRGDTENARRYLIEVLETTPFSSKKDSTWMKAKTLLLEVYNLEGEF